MSSDVERVKEQHDTLHKRNVITSLKSGWKWHSLSTRIDVAVRTSAVAWTRFAAHDYCRLGHFRMGEIK